MSAPAETARPLCADVAAHEDLTATASRIEHWLLIEFGGHWPYEPLDATIFAGRVRDHLAGQLAALPNSRLLLVKQPGRLRPTGIRVFYGATRERRRRFYTLELEAPGELLDLDVVEALAEDGSQPGEPLAHPLLLVCTHGKRDRCCARYGQPLCEALHATPSRPWVWQASHVGGDRFAGNLVCLPEGLYFGRVGRTDVEPLLAEYREGRIALELYRGRSSDSFVVQAAEGHVRRATGLRGFADLRLLEHRRDAQDAWTVRLVAEVAGTVHEVTVERRLGEPEYLTCRAEVPRRPRHYAVTGHAVVDPSP